MNIGLVLPVEREHEQRIFGRLHQVIGSFIFAACPFEVHKIELIDGVNLIICRVLFCKPDIVSGRRIKKRLRLKLEKIFVEHKAWPILEHSDAAGFFHFENSLFEDVFSEVAVNRFAEVLKLIQGIGDITLKEVAVSGRSIYLEHAIERLLTKVKVLNILIPEGSYEPREAEEAFIETGIPVHITTDPEVLNRSAVWLRFPDDDKSFDSLPEFFKGVIIDFGVLKIIDTKNEKIFSITIEFSDKIKRKIGHSILNYFDKGVLEGVVIATCSNAWDINVTETSVKLGMRMSFIS